jgi:hypothetical protein
VLFVKEVDSDELDAQEWNYLLSNSEVCDAFQTYDWGLALRNSLGVRPRFMLVIEGERIVGGVMLFAKKMFRIIDSYEVRGGPLYIRGYKEMVMKSILKAIDKKKNRSANILFVPYPIINNSFEKTFKAEGYSLYPFRTIVIDLNRKLKDIWQALDKRARWGVRKAEGMGLAVKEADNWHEWEQFSRLHQLHGREKHYPTDPPEFFEEMFKLNHKKMAHLFLAKRGKDTVAGSLFLVYKQNMVFLQNASRRAFLAQNPNNLLQWKSMEWGKENGVTIYDMNGLPPKEVPYLRGVYNYKKKWDGQIHWYYYYINRRLLLAPMHLVRTSNLAWKLFLSARNLQAV